MTVSPDLGEVDMTNVGANGLVNEEENKTELEEVDMTDVGTNGLVREETQ